MIAGTWLSRVKEVAGAVMNVMAAAVLVISAALATVLLIGTIHIFYRIW